MNSRDADRRDREGRFDQNESGRAAGDEPPRRRLPRRQQEPMQTDRGHQCQRELEQHHHAHEDADTAEPRKMDSEVVERRRMPSKYRELRPNASNSASRPAERDRRVPRRRSGSRPARCHHRRRANTVIPMAPAISVTKPGNASVSLLPRRAVVAKDRGVGEEPVAR